MDAQTHSNGRDLALDDLVRGLLDCGGVLSQIIAGMVEFQASEHAPADLVPIPDIAFDLVRSVTVDHVRGRSRRDLAVAAAIVAEVTTAISEDIYRVNFDALGDADMN
jgi:hypothetical protein